MMVFLGIPPQLAGITFKLWKIGNSLAWVRNFHKEGLIRKEYLLWLWFTMMLWWGLGSFFIMDIPDWIMYYVSAISMIILVGVALVKKKTWVERNVQISWIRMYVWYFSYFILSFLWNLFPAGSGIWYYFANTYILKLSTLEGKATGNAIAIFWFIGTAIGVFSQGSYNLIYAFFLALGMFLWGHFATKHMIQIWERKTRNILLIWISIFSLYFLYLGYNSLQ